MLAIRMQRNGRKGTALYRIVVQEAQRHPLSGRIVAQVGSFNPHTKTIVLDKTRVQEYLDHGAQPSTRVVRILKVEGVKLPKWVVEAPKKVAKARHAEKLRKNQPKSVPVDQPKEVTVDEEPAGEAQVEAFLTEADTAKTEGTTAEAAA